MGDEDKPLARTTTTTGPHEVIDYRFAVEIYVRQAPLDEKRVRELVDDELQRLGTAIKNAK